MSSNNLFPAMSGPISPEQMCGDVNNNVLVSTDWYTPVPYTYDQPYLTPFPSSTVESQQWNQYTRASIPDINMVTYPMAHPTNMFHAPIQNAPGRPRSSPSTFGPSPENLEWTPSAGLGIQYTTAAGQPTPLTSTFPPVAFPTYGTQLPFGNASPPQIQQPQPRRPYQSIAPNPAGVTTLKRQREEDEAAATFAADESRPPSGNKRRRTVSSAAEISDDDRLLLLLREGERLPWKEIAARFTEDKQEDYTTARLQMKYKRLREKFRDWEEVDTNALKLACEHFEKVKWQLIAAKMGEFGVAERWSPRYCEHKWRELSSTSTTMAVTSSMPLYSSPLETPMAFVGMPYQ